MDETLQWMSGNAWALLLTFLYCKLYPEGIIIAFTENNAWSYTHVLAQEPAGNSILARIRGIRAAALLQVGITPQWITPRTHQSSMKTIMQEIYKDENVILEIL